MISDRDSILSRRVLDGGTEMTIEEMYSRMGAPWFDFEKYKTTGMLDEILRLSENFLTHSGPESVMCPDSVAYWRKKGLNKEYYTDPDGDYVVFSPADTEPGKKYPLIFTISGDNSNLYFTETLGFTELAAEEKLIQVIPVINLPGRREPSMDRDRPAELIDLISEKYPVDETRIYMTGFSHGGILSQWNGIAHCERFAGICASGIRPGDGAPKRVAPSFMIFYDYPVTEKVRRAHVPAVYCIGMAEQPEHLPLYHENTKPHFEHYVDEHVSMLKYITDMNELPELREEDILRCEFSEDECERAIGLPLKNTRTEEHFGAKHFFGDMESADGVVRTRVIGVENQPHHPSGAWARLSWDFISKFRRDPETGLSFRED